MLKVKHSCLYFEWILGLYVCTAFSFEELEEFEELEPR